MPDTAYGIYYLKSKLTREKMHRLRLRLVDEYNLTDRSNNDDEIFLTIRLGDEFEISLVNPESRPGLYDEPLIFNGKKQALLWLYSGNLDVPSLFYEYEEASIGFKPVFTTIGRMLDAYFGIIASENNFALTFRELFEIPSMDTIHLSAGKVPSKIRRAFENHGFVLSKKARLEENPIDRSELDIVDDSRRYWIFKKPWGIEIQIKDNEMPSKNLEYLEAMLKKPIWTNLYMDEEMFNSIGSATISHWAKQIERINDNAYFIGCVSNPSPFFHGCLDDELYLIFKHMMLPVILDRIRIESTKD